MNYFGKLKLLALAAAVASLAISAHTASGQGSGKPGTATATLTFDDLDGDAIRSDGLGPYGVSIEQTAGDIVVSLGKQQDIRLDFSDCDHGANLSCEGPFGPDTTSGYVGGASIDITMVDWEPGVPVRVGVRVYFKTSTGAWELRLSAEVTAYDSDSDGAMDRYVIDHDGATATSLGKFVNNRGVGQSPNYIEQGRFFMPWGATLELD